VVLAAALAVLVLASIFPIYATVFGRAPRAGLLGVLH